jgi:FtsH-binding integral membrane protein
MSSPAEYDYNAADMFVIDAAVEERVAFIRRTYLHLVGAILAFIGLEALFLNTPAIYGPLLQMIGGSWWLVLIAFVAVSWIAEKWAHSGASPGTQYAGLALYTVAEAVIFCPLLLIASHFGGPDVIPTAGFLTLMIFGGLTAIVFLTRSDFSFLRSALWLGSIAAMGIVLVSMFMGFSLGIVFVSAMIVLMSGWILYDTSNILHHYRTDQHVGAALALFASLATLFWYVIRLVMILQDRD